ncbi:MAG: hypothetical protein AAFY76_26635, partial [Cyanobacteria bacterium J06649_11]
VMFSIRGSSMLLTHTTIKSNYIKALAINLSTKNIDYLDNNTYLHKSIYALHKNLIIIDYELPKSL